MFKDGIRQSDVQSWAGTYYYFDHATYLRVDNAYKKSNWGDYYLFGSDGRIQTQVQKWAGTYYYFDKKTYLKRTNAYLKSQWGGYYLFGSDGRIQTGVQKWAGSYYYFDKSTYLKRTNAYLKSQWGSWYLFKSSGKIASGWFTYGVSSYYFNPYTYLLEKTVSSKMSGQVYGWTIGDPMRPKITAVDISSYQSGLTQANYNTLKSLGVKTVIVKLTEGSSYNNPYAATQIKRAQSAGLNVAVYDYAKFSTTTAAASEAKYMITYLKKYGISKSVTVIADMEDTSTYSSNAANNLNKFWSTLSASGYTNHVVYTYVSYKYRDAVVLTVGKSKTWIAQYPYSPFVNTFWDSSYGAWQVSSQAYLPGYSGNIDVSVDYNGLLANM
ncbi:Mannosyl-glycoprotein endo-beta-N-acetylglucosamidase [Paucilactobacillus wasatchensis]|uniref:Mannosyl-glycoprotein endo-beta-N-acetylglucosamidase n=1 Tax=Paucilactobacillus wasatchensis TaxID=1335616 RepID=A0A0D1A6L4_9LACO|nr:GH25 family lysozyme [Paucilactobacillus wasatchensis]KIS03510.1 Mannosyl-glycoprotein endo-beta-N-acetylglucosamidase [Paucilactobacillus wasatchensis]